MPGPAVRLQAILYLLPLWPRGLCSVERLAAGRSRHVVVCGRVCGVLPSASGLALRRADARRTYIRGEAPILAVYPAASKIHRGAWVD